MATYVAINTIDEELVVAKVRTRMRQTSDPRIGMVVQ